MTQVVFGIVLALLVAGGAHWALSAGHATGDRAAVEVRVQRDNASALLFNGTVDLAAGNATALGSLLAASHLGNFSVTVSGAYWEPFVVEIGGIRNSGACGWVFSVDHLRGSRGAASTHLATGQRVEWYWGCG